MHYLEFPSIILLESMETLNLKDVVCELNDFSGWYQLGVFMNVPKNVLDQIHADYGHGPNAMRRCQIEMISYWLDNGRDPTWSFLISALHSIGKTVLAVKIANRYGKQDVMGSKEHCHGSVRYSMLQI